jgi:FixJ family two-component response regulator
VNEPEITGSADALALYLAERDDERAETVRRTLAAMTERERWLVREAAVMGYVCGQIAGSVGVDAIPRDSAVLAEVVDACLALDDLYPTMNSLTEEG